MPIRLTQTIKILLGLYFASFLIQHTGDQFFGTHFLLTLGLTPTEFIYGHQYWQLFTYSFIHSDVMHLFFNMMLLAFIGGELEVSWGRARFLRFYFFCATIAGLCYLLIQAVAFKTTGYHGTMVGASGAIYGLLMAYGLIFGERVLLFMMLFPMKAKQFVWILVLIELLTTIYTPGGSIAGIAHLGGMAAGFFYLWVKARYLISQRSGTSFFRTKPAKKKRPSKHLKLIVNNHQESEAEDEDTENDPRTWH
jgi:membrane associated rhomboid family serine protease